MATKSEFRRVRVDGKYAYVKRLSLGGEVRKQGDEFFAYDGNGHYLGWTNSQEEAEYMAQHGFTNSTCEDTAPELGLWEAWNDAVVAGATVLLGPSGEQVICLGGSVYLVASDDDRGWSVELLTDVELGQRYVTDEYECVRQLKVIDRDKAFRLK